VFIKENVLTIPDVMFLVSENPLFLLGSSGSPDSDIILVDDVDQLQIIEDTIVTGGDLVPGVYEFRLTARVIISGVLTEEVVNVTINIKGKKYGISIIKKC